MAILSPPGRCQPSQREQPGHEGEGSILPVTSGAESLLKRLNRGENEKYGEHDWIEVCAKWEDHRILLISGKEKRVFENELLLMPFNFPYTAFRIG